MAVIHISEADAAENLPGLIAKANAGEDIYIDAGSGTVRLVKVGLEADGRLLPRHTKPRLLSEMIAELEREGSTVTLDGGFEEHLMAVINEHEKEVMFDPWDAS